MSRSYRKHIREFLATGSNTEYYRKRNRNLRRYNNQKIREASQYSQDLIDENLNIKYIPREDQWDEPTDGHYLISERRLRNWVFHEKGTFKDKWYKHHLYKFKKRIRQKYNHPNNLICYYSKS